MGYIHWSISRHSHDLVGLRCFTEGLPTAWHLVWSCSAANCFDYMIRFRPRFRSRLLPCHSSCANCPTVWQFLILQGIHGRGLHPSLGKIDFVVESLELQMRRDPATRMHLAANLPAAKQSSSCIISFTKKQEKYSYVFMKKESSQSIIPYYSIIIP